jgi:hypothetical protein
MSTGTLTLDLAAETTARSGADSALTTRVENVAMSTGTLTVNLAAETTARSGADSALTTRVENVAMSTGTLTLDLAAETTARSGADSALTTRVENVAMSTGTLTVNLAAVVLSTGPLANSGAWNGNLNVGGGLSLPIMKVTADYPITGNDDLSTILADCSGGDITVTLPDVTGINGRIYTIKRTDDPLAGNTLWIIPAAGQNIDGLYDNGLPIDTSLGKLSLVSTHGEAVTLQSFEGNWMILSWYY